VRLLSQTIYIVTWWISTLGWALLLSRYYRAAASARGSASPRAVWNQLNASTSERLKQSEEVVRQAHAALVQQTEEARTTALTIGSLALATWSIVLSLDSSDAVPAVAGQLLLATAALSLGGSLIFHESGLLAPFIGLYVTQSLAFGALLLAVGALAPVAFPDLPAQLLGVLLTVIYLLGQFRRVMSLWPYVTTEVGGS
jgi:predicted tellurium resistance membrane protein TerC